MSTYPNQRVSFSKKQQEDWYVPTTDYFIEKALSEKDLTRVINCLNAANGIANKEDFDYVLKPFNQSPGEGAQLKSPIDIRSVDFITPMIEKLMGEYLELPYKYMVVVNSDDSVILRDAACAEAIFMKIEEAVTNYLEQMQQAVMQGQQDPASLEQLDLEAFAKEFKTNWVDERAVKAQYILDHVYKYNDFDYQRVQAYYYWMNTNEVYTYRHIENGELIREVISPLEGFPISNGEDFVEDYDGFVIKRKVTFPQLISEYLNEGNLSVEDVKYLENLNARYSADYKVTELPLQLLKSRHGFKPMADGFEHLDFTNEEGELFVYTCIFKSETKVKILRYINQMGQTVEMPVASNYVLNPEVGDLDLETTYINEVLVSKRFGEKHVGIYTKPVRDLVQRYDSVTRSPKLPVNGKVGILHGMQIKPIALRLIPFEVVDRILLHQIETTMSKYKGSILLMPKSLIKTDDTGTTREKYFYMRADGSLIYDDADVDFNTIAQGVRFVTDDVLGRYLETLIALRQANRQDAYEVTSMNSDRNAQVDTRANVSNVQQNIYRGKLGSALLIYTFNKIFERDHAADIEYAKYAYVNGISDSFYDSDTNLTKPYSFDTIDLLEQKIGIFVSNSKTDEAKLRFISDTLAHAASQNAEFDIAIEAATIDSIPQLKQRIKELSDNKRAFEEQMRQVDGEIEQKRHENKLAEIEAVNMKDIQIALINKDYKEAITLENAISEMQQASTPTQESTAKDLQAQMKTTLDKIRTDLEVRKQDHKERQDAISNRLKDKKIEADKYIAKINKN